MGNSFLKSVSELGPSTTFSNHVGKYEAIRVDGSVIHYRFTDRSGNTTIASMSIDAWRRASARAERDLMTTEASRARKAA